MEILSPAGSPEAVRAAVCAGANAIYLGYGAFNARRNARNFTEEEVAQTIEHGAECLSLGKRILRTETAGLAMLSMLMLSIECSEQ